MSTSEQNVAPPPDAFRFGRNWQRYVADYLAPEREEIAAKSLHDLLETDLAGRTFIDIGCGSGLFSLCAHNDGASGVVSVDVDPDSVAATSALRERAGSPADWKVIHGSILDEALLEQVAPAEVVYSWGVLHHTGDMWTAIRNASRLVAPGGIFCIAIYNRVTDRYLNSDRWLRIKRAYNHSSRPVQVAMEWAYTLQWGLDELRSKNNPVRLAREYKQHRGMALRTDLIDWLGGYPFEFATADEIVLYCEEALGFQTLKVVKVPEIASGNNEFVFRRPPSH